MYDIFIIPRYNGISMVFTDEKRLEKTSKP